MQAEIEILQVEKKIRSRVKKQMEKTQKEYYLNEQMQAIQKELGGGERDEFKNEIQEIEETLKTKRMSKEAGAKVKKELKKLKMMHPTSAEATVVRNYIDWIITLPWYDKSEETYDLKKADEVLDEDHYGLKKIKERILEYLAVQALTKKLKGPVLCFVGPPGVGKTSLAKSIARATGRKFVRLSLGGVRDEAEIRGHRRTYIGAMPGKLIQSLQKVGTNNPVFLLDEVDKMSTDFRGDPAAALLEVLDPEQNHGFNDHYLDLDYDLSDVMFITTANTLGGIPIPLQDRMEIIQLSGYTEFEKLNIAVKYLVPRQRKECGLEDVPLTISENAIRTIIHHYTREAGVRSLEREIASICRKVARQVVADGKEKAIEVVGKDVPKYLGVPKFRRRQEGGARRDRAHQRPLGDVQRRRRAPRVRGRGRRRQGQARHHGPAREGDGGERAGGDELRALARRGARARAGFLPEGRRARSLPRVRPEGRAERGRDDGDEPRERAHQGPGEARPGDDGRDHAARPRDAHRRAEGEAPRGAPERDHDGHRPQGEPQGPARGAAARAQGDAHRARRAHGRGPARGARACRSPTSSSDAGAERWEYRDGELVVIPRPSPPPSGRGRGDGPGKPPPPRARRAAARVTRARSRREGCGLDRDAAPA